MRAHSVWAIHFLNRDLSNLGNAAKFPISKFCDDPPSWPMHMTSAIKNAADSLHGQEMVVFVRSASLLETRQAAIAQIARESVCRTAIRGGKRTVGL